MGSTREPYNYIQAKKLGCKIITAPPSIIEKIENFKNISDKNYLFLLLGF